jgi:type IX secretion system PorP/SprF family membrane protein
MKRSILMIVCFVCLTTFIKAQQDAQFTQYFDNMLFVNPAYAGSRGMLNITSMHREQWVGFEGRPRSTTFSIHSPLKYESVGLGLTMVSDEAGPVKQNMFYVDFSYSITFQNKSKLVFGIKGGMNMISIEKTSLSTIVDGDPKLLSNVRNNINPNFGTGIFYHSENFFFGVSSPKILEQSYDGSKTDLEKRHYFLMTGGIIKLNTNWKLRPSFQAKYAVGAPLSLDMSCAGIYDEKLWLGATYRLAAAYGFYVQYQITNQFKVGLATDFGTQKIRKFNSGTLEALISYDFKFNKVGIRSPRLF